MHSKSLFLHTFFRECVVTHGSFKGERVSAAAAHGEILTFCCELRNEVRLDSVLLSHTSNLSFQ